MVMIFMPWKEEKTFFLFDDDDKVEDEYCREILHGSSFRFFVGHLRIFTGCGKIYDPFFSWPCGLETAYVQ